MVQYPNDDLFEGTAMTFGEHLEELRKSLFKAVIGIVLGFLVGMWFASDVVKLLTDPLQGALERYYIEKAKEDVDFSRLPPGVSVADVQQAIDTERLVPDSSIKVDVSSLLITLKTVAPDGFGDLPSRPSVFVPNDLPLDQVLPLAKRWVDANAEKDALPTGAALAKLAAAEKQAALRTSIAATLFAGLSADDRKFVESVAKLDEATEADRIEMLRTLNRSVGDQKLAFENDLVTDYEAAYGGIVFPTAVSLREQALKSRDRSDAASLNQLVVATAFPGMLLRHGIPLVDLPTWKTADVRVQALGASEGFMIWMKAAFFTGMVLASPWVFYQIWVFVAAGLYPHEKNYVYIYLPFSLGLFMAGVLLAYSFVFQPVLDFLFTFNKMTNIDPDPRISEWLGFVLFLPLGFGVSFQLPLVMLFIQRIGLIETQWYISNWRVSIMAICVISMVLTPSDPYSMLFMAVPLVILFGVGILLCIYMPRGRNRFQESFDPA